MKAFQQFAKDQFGGMDNAVATVGKPGDADFNKKLLDQTELAVKNKARCTALPS